MHMSRTFNGKQTKQIAHLCMANMCTQAQTGSTPCSDLALALIIHEYAGDILSSW